MANASILAAFERMWQHITSALSNKSDISHTHEGMPYWVEGNDKDGGVMVCDSGYGLIRCAGDYVKSVNGSTGTVTIPNATTSANGLMSASDKAKLDNTNVSYGTCSTVADVAAKVVSLSGNTNWKLTTGSIIMVSFTNTNTAEGVTINVNNTGAYPIWYNASEYTGAGNAYTGYAGRVTTYMFNGTHWVWVSNSYDANTQSNTNSTDTSNKIYLVGATSQGSNKTTYSHGEVYVGTDHHVYSNGKQVVNLSDSQDLTNKTCNGNKIMTSANVIAAVKTISFDAGVGTYTNSAIKASSIVFAQWRAGAVSTMNDSVLGAYPKDGYMTIISKSGNTSSMPVLILIINP